MPDNSQKLQLIQSIRQSGYPGSVTEVFQAYDQGQDLIGQWVQQQQQQQEMQQQQGPPGSQGMAQGPPPQSQAPPMNRPDGRVSQPNVNQPIDNNQGHLVQSQNTQNVGIQDLPTGPAQGQMIQAREGGVRKYHEGGTLYDINGIQVDDTTAHMQEPHHTVGDTSSSSMYDYANENVNPDGTPIIDFGFNIGAGGNYPIISGRGAKQIGDWGKGVWNRSSHLGKAGIIASGVGAPLALLGAGLDPTSWMGKKQEDYTGGFNSTGGVRQEVKERKSKSYINNYSHGGSHLGGSQYAFGLGPQTNTSIMDRYYADQPGIGQMDFSNTGNLLQSNREYNSALQAQERQNQNFQTGIDKLPFKGKDNAFSQAQQYYPGGENFLHKGNEFKNERVSQASNRLNTEGWKGPIPQGILDAYGKSGTTKDPTTGYASGFEGIDPNQFRVGSLEWQYLYSHPEYSNTQNQELFDQFQTYAGTDENQPANMAIIKEGIESGKWTQIDIDNLKKGQGGGGRIGMIGNPNDIPLNTADLLTQLQGGGHQIKDGIYSLTNARPVMGPLFTTPQKKEEDDYTYDPADFENDVRYDNIDKTGGSDNLQPGLPNFTSGNSIDNRDIVYDETQGGTKTQLPDGRWVDRVVQPTISQGHAPGSYMDKKIKRETAEYHRNVEVGNNMFLMQPGLFTMGTPWGNMQGTAEERGKRQLSNFKGGLQGTAAGIVIGATGGMGGSALATGLTWGAGAYGANQMLNPYSSGGASLLNFANDPSLSNAGSLGGDALWTIPALGKIKNTKFMQGLGSTAKTEGTALKTSLTTMPKLYNPAATTSGFSTRAWNAGANALNTSKFGTKITLDPNILKNIDKFGSKFLNTSTNAFSRSRTGELNKMFKSTDRFFNPQSYAYKTPYTGIGSSITRSGAAGDKFTKIGSAVDMLKSSSYGLYNTGKFATSVSALGTAGDLTYNTLAGNKPLSLSTIGEGFNAGTDAFYSNLSRAKDFGKGIGYTFQGKFNEAGTEFGGLFPSSRSFAYPLKIYNKWSGDK